MVSTLKRGDKEVYNEFIYTRKVVGFCSAKPNLRTTEASLIEVFARILYSL